MQTVAASAGVSQHSTSQIMQTKHLIQFPKQQESTVRADFRPMEFQPHPTVKTKPHITRFACTLQVTHLTPPPTASTC
jgi:hypothetical protein